MEIFTLLLFCAALILCVIFDFSIIYALILGLLFFILYGLVQKYSLMEMFHMCLEGIKTAHNILITFLLIGILTAFWRAAGTIPTIVCYASVLIRPSLFLLMSFLLNCAVSILTGTAFGTAATMGVICAAMAVTMHISPLLTGGAILSGVYFGDRCSPVSTSALLVSELTQTNIFDNIRRMLKTAGIPFLLTCVFYLMLGILTPHSSASLDLTAIFGAEFLLHWVCLLPAIIILIFSIFRINVKTTMLISILFSIPICLQLQRIPVTELIPISVFGYHAQDAKVASMLNGGGIISMLKVAAVVCLSSAYSGIFKKTGLLNPIRSFIFKLSSSVTQYGATLITSILAGAVSCNQTLAIMLTCQLCRDIEPDRQKFAIDLENTAVILAPLIPWSIASGVPLASAEAPTGSILFACFLYLLPLWQLALALHCKIKEKYL